MVLVLELVVLTVSMNMPCRNTAACGAPWSQIGRGRVCKFTDALRKKPHMMESTATQSAFGIRGTDIGIIYGQSSVNPYGTHSYAHPFLVRLCTCGMKRFFHGPYACSELSLAIAPHGLANSCILKRHLATTLMLNLFLRIHISYLEYPLSYIPRLPEPIFPHFFHRDGFHFTLGSGSDSVLHDQ